MRRLEEILSRPADWPSRQPQHGLHLPRVPVDAWGKMAEPTLRGKEQIVRAMVMPQFGGPDLFEERDVERPHPGPGEVLVRVVAAGTNPVDAKLRASGDVRGLEAPIILGADISGVVEEVLPLEEVGKAHERLDSGHGRGKVVLRITKE